MSIAINKDFFTSPKFFLAASTLIVIVLSITYYFVSSNDSKEEAEQYPDVVVISNDDPSEKDLDDYVWKGLPEEPKHIDLPTIGAGGYIQKVSVDQRKEIAVPSNVGLAGWFIKSQKPNQDGLSIIGGHVDGRSKPGIFKNLHKMKTGDEFSVEYGNGEKQAFKVTGITMLRDHEAPRAIFSQDPAHKSQLNLVTCGGEYDRNERRYLDRYIISSIPV